MSKNSLIPWKKNGTRMPVRRVREEDTLLDLQSRMNRLFDEFFERPFGFNPYFDESDMEGDFNPRMDVSETEKEITISAELPGLAPEDIAVSLDRNILTISGEKHAEKEEKGKRLHRVERSYGFFSRSLPLPSEVEEEKIDATFKQGVLMVKLPKTKKAQESSKRIVIKAG